MVFLNHRHNFVGLATSFTFPTGLLISLISLYSDVISIVPLTRAPKTLPALHCWRNFPRLCILHHTSQPILPPASSRKSLNSKTGSTSWEVPRSPWCRSGKAPGAGEQPSSQAGTHTGEWHSCCSSWSGASPTVQEEQTAWPIHSSIPSALSLAGTSAHNRPLSSQSSLHTLQLLKVALGTTVQGKTSEKQSKLVYFGPLAAIYGWPLQFPW